ncbi:MAG: phenylalanine--tRNA ligase subunit beta, partial [Alphaproteobacteria bacterium]
VTSAKPHPDADRLQVCMVDTGSEAIQVVCGAPNAHAGMKAVFAASGTTLPGTGLRLKPTTIRGVASNGMLCSEREMGLSDEHDGIIELDGKAHVGAPFAEAAGLDDPVFDIAITPNRPDCLGVRGVARDLAAADMGTLVDKPIKPVAGTFENPVAIALEFDDAAGACPVFAGRYIRGVTNRASPAWLRQRLRAIGLKPINALVDITNFITHDRARPLHVYDADTLTGTIRARLGKAGESVAALDGKTYKIDERDCVIADDAAVLGLGGIIGGTATGSTEKTTNVLVECALFDPIRTAMTGRRLGVDSDARYRFERGVDPAFVLPGLELATAMILEICGGQASQITVCGKIPEPEKIISFNPAIVERLSGMKLPLPEIKFILKKLGFWIAGRDAVLNVAAPTWRPDIFEAADLVEEVVRIAGTDRLPSTALPRLTAVTRPALSPGQKRVQRARRGLAARGMVEAVTWSFIARGPARIFGGGGDALELLNPISSEMSSMRPSLLPGLVAAAQRNADRGFPDCALFEVGQVFAGVQASDQQMVAGGVRRGTAQTTGAGRHWHTPGNSVGGLDAKADALGALAAIGVAVDKVQVTSDAPDWFHPGRSGVLRLGPKTVLAHFGVVHPRALASLDTQGPLVGFEVFLDAVPAPRKSANSARAPLNASDLQPITRDFAFVVDEKIKAGDLVRAAQNADKTLITGVTLFDIYVGAGIGEGQKSLGVEVVLQPRDKTLNDEQIEAVAEKIVASVLKATGGSLRG